MLFSQMQLVCTEATWGLSGIFLFLFFFFPGGCFIAAEIFVLPIIEKLYAAAGGGVAV